LLDKYLRDELDWPIDSDNFEDLTFDYRPEELGPDAKTAVEIKRARKPQTGMSRSFLWRASPAGGSFWDRF
jgi:hypothetical protein